MYIINNMGPRIVPRGIPLITSVHSEKKPIINLTPCFLKHKKDLIQFIILGLTVGCLWEFKPHPPKPRLFGFFNSVTCPYPCITLVLNSIRVSPWVFPFLGFLEPYSVFLKDYTHAIQMTRARTQCDSGSGSGSCHIDYFQARRTCSDMFEAMRPGVTLHLLTDAASMAARRGSQLVIIRREGT